MSDITKARLLLHFTVILFGFTAILGKLLDLNAFTLVWWRMIFSIFFFILYFRFKRFPLESFFKNLELKYLGIGFLIALHWYCFYGSVKISHASVALICMSFTTLVTSILEPLINRNKFSLFDLIYSIFIIPLIIWLIGGVKNFSLEGFIIGVLAAILASIFSILNKRHVHDKTNLEWMSFVQFVGVAIFCTPIAIYYFLKEGFLIHSPFDIKNFFLMMALSIVCTNFAFLFSLQTLKKLSVFENNLIIGLEPVYGLILAYLFLDEGKYFGINFYLAALLIFTLIFLHPLITKKIYY